MFKKTIALLGLVEPETPEENLLVPEEGVQVDQEDVLELERVSTDIDTDREAIDEAQETSETIGRMADTAERATDGLPVEGQEVLEAAIEHFYNRLGYSDAKLAVSTEGYTSANAKDRTAESAKKLRLAQEQISKNISIAQEGLWDKIKTKFDQVFTTSKKLSNQLALASAGYDKKGAVTEPIPAKQLSVYLNPEGKAELTGKDVVDQLTAIAKLVDEDALVKLVQEAAKLANDLVGNVESSAFVAKDEETAVIKAATERLAKIASDFNETVNGTGKKASAEVKMQPVESSEKAKLVKLCDELITGNKLESALAELSKKYGALFSIIMSNSSVRFAGAWADDIKAAEAAAKEIVALGDKVSSLLSDSFKVTLSAVRYLELSTAK